MSYVEIHGFDPIERGRRRKEWIEPMKKKENGGGDNRSMSGGCGKVEA